MGNRLSNNNIGHLILFYIIWPFGAWLASLKQANTKAAYVIFFLFSLLLCWHMSPNGAIHYDDFVGIMERFNSTNITSNMMVEEFEAFITFSDDAPKELYGDFLTWFVKLFTDNYHFFFLVASIPVALCQLKCLKYITSDRRFVAGSFLSFLVLAMFIFPRDIITVQNPRFATGLWWSILVTIRYALDRRNKLLCAILILLSPFFHSALWVYVAMFYICLLVPNTRLFVRICEIVALISIPFCFIDAELFTGLSLDFLPHNLSVWASLYVSDEAKARLIEHEGASGFFMVGLFFNIALKLCYMLMTWQLIRNKKHFKCDEGTNRLYICYLVLFASINLIQFVPELGSRYFYMVRILCILIWFKVFWGEARFYKPFYLLCIISLWPILFRYGYVFGGALSVNTPMDIWFAPLPYLAGKGLFW